MYCSYYCNTCYSARYSIPKYLCFTRVTYFFIFSLLTLRSQNRRMVGSWVCYEQLGVWCSFNIPRLDSSLVPLFSGWWGNFRRFCQEFDGALIWRVVVTKRWTYENGKIFFQKRDNRVTFFCKKYASLPLPIFEEPWRTRWGYSADYR